ncbi:pentatricopeptide repeat-containing protein At2g29760, chloroplastic-like [Aristolochia californica]|uniref:pentatricopeptide repeat-containing protein At2g29760, chloroplastic-like n=1 Tax=Aristolochia californica TaxID=171875 RepID=UPI0035DC1EEE
MQISSFSTPLKPRWNSNSMLVVTNPVLCIMESCSSMTQLKQIQAHMTRTGLMTHRFPASRVLSFCALSDSGDINHARLVFSQIEVPNVFIWNTMIRGYAKAKCPESGFSLFYQMIEEKTDLDNRTFVFALKISELFSEVSVGEQVHCQILKVGFYSNLLVRNALMHFYVKYGFLSSARLILDENFESDVVSWTTMIDGYAQKNLPNEALKLFCAMIERKVEPNEVTMVTVLSACSRMGILNLGRSIHKNIETNNEDVSVNVLNALLDMYVKCGSLDVAMVIFRKMEFKDVFTWTTSINGYAKAGDLTFARQLFEEMPERNVVSWNALIAGYTQTNQPQEALDLFHEMNSEGLQPTEGTLVSVLSACGQLGSFDLGRWIYEYHIEGKRIQLSVILGNAFIDMYAKCGNIDAALRLFHEMPKRDLVSWNSMISACAMHGIGEKALVLFEQMKSEGLVPDDITFVGVLCACSHGGLVAEGRKYFNCIGKVYGMEPKVEHYACMIDLLGRVGLIEEAYELVRKMPMEPDAAGWGALLNACKMHGNVEFGKLAGDKLMQLDPHDSGIYVLLSNMYATRNRWDDVKTVRKMMRAKRVKKTPGCSSIQVDGKFHEFLVADNSHSQSEEIYMILDDLYFQLKLEGYVPNTSQLMGSHEGIDYISQKRRHKATLYQFSSVSV